MINNDIKNVAILGSGCAGLTAAIYCARANLDPIIFAGTQYGGQLTTTTEVENFPGFPDGISGPELMTRMSKQAEKFGTKMQYEQIDSIEKRRDAIGNLFVLKQKSESGKDKQKYKTRALTRTLIIATGAEPRYLSLPGESNLIGKGLSVCATCDGAFFRDEVMIVVGGGDSACEEAIFLTKFASKVYLVHRRDELRASKIMAERALKNEKIEPIWNAEIVEYLTGGDGNVRGAQLHFKNGQKKELAARAIFLAIGHSPNTAFLGTLIELDDEKYIIQKNGIETNVNGIFAAGDVADRHYRQAITAAGQGCAAALSAERYLSDLE